jgi:hypothetical protein
MKGETTVNSGDPFLFFSYQAIPEIFGMSGACGCGRSSQSEVSTLTPGHDGHVPLSAQIKEFDYAIGCNCTPSEYFAGVLFDYLMCTMQAGSKMIYLITYFAVGQDCNLLCNYTTFIMRLTVYCQGCLRAAVH